MDGRKASGRRGGRCYLLSHCRQCSASFFFLFSSCATKSFFVCVFGGLTRGVGAVVVRACVGRALFNSGVQLEIETPIPCVSRMPPFPT